jgi:hypothetical protein
VMDVRDNELHSGHQGEYPLCELTTNKCLPSF